MELQENAAVAAEEAGNCPVVRGPRCHFCQSQFYSKMTQGRGYNYAFIRKWTQRKDVFSKDLIIVPIHVNGNHWTLAVINFTLKRFEYYDSLFGDPGDVLLNLRRWLEDESVDKRNTRFDASSYVDVVYKTSTPKQSNGYDYGVFMLTTARYLACDAKLTFTQEDMPSLRRRLVLEILRRIPSHYTREGGGSGDDNNGNNCGQSDSGGSGGGGGLDAEEHSDGSSPTEDSSEDGYIDEDGGDGGDGIGKDKPTAADPAVETGAATVAAATIAIAAAATAVAAAQTAFSATSVPLAASTSTTSRGRPLRAAAKAAMERTKPQIELGPPVPPSLCYLSCLERAPSTMEDAGYGCKTLQKITQGTVVAIYTGELLPVDTKVPKALHEYVMQQTSTMVVVGDPMVDMAASVNEPCHPDAGMPSMEVANLAAEHVEVEVNGEVLQLLIYVTAIDIQANAELTVSYGLGGPKGKGNQRRGAAAPQRGRVPAGDLRMLFDAFCAGRGITAADVAATYGAIDGAVPGCSQESQSSSQGSGEQSATLTAIMDRNARRLR